jgi:hypothetical protein
LHPSIILTFPNIQLPALSSLATDLKVCFIGDATCPANQQQIRKVLKVRREKVCTAITWLCKNHTGYIKLVEEGMVINSADIADLPEDDIPSVIVQNMTLSDDVEAASSESSSYVPPIDPKDDDSDGPSIGPIAASSADVHTTPPPLVPENSPSSTSSADVHVPTVSKSSAAVNCKRALIARQQPLCLQRTLPLCSALYWYLP